MESFSDDLTRIGNQDKCFRLLLFDEVPKLYGLHTIQGCQNNVTILTGKSSGSLYCRSTSVQLFYDEVADRFRMFADNVKIFAEIQTLDHVVNHQGTYRKTKYRVETRFNIEDKKSQNGNNNITGKESVSDIKAGVFFLRS